MNDRPLIKTALVLVCLWAAPSAARAQRNLKDIPPPDPELERKALEVAEGFEINLYAADPAIAKPIQMNFDPQGRLWLATSEVYPHIEPGQKANDKIVVLADEDGDGVSDRTTVFADGLLIPTGVAPGDGGAYVANSTELLHLADTDGDGRADRERVVLSGFGTEDTHHILHTLRWGQEGLLYFNQSIYIHSHIETPYGVRRLNAGGIWWFRPETMQLEVFARGWVNSWGHDFDRWGQSFVTDGAGGEGINFAVPGAAYPTAYGVPRILHGLNPGSPKYCGLELVDGRHLPDDWQGNAITHDFRGHRVCRFILSDDGSGFAARLADDLVKTDHVAFRPVDVKMGPDGAIYIADWYNPIIQHGEVDFRDPRRDHTHGRIWRVTAKGRPLVPRPQLVSASTPELLDALTAPESWTRRQAKRVLKERGPEAVLPHLKNWRVAGRADFVLHANLEALWTYQALDVVEPELLGGLLRAPVPQARAAATRVLWHWSDRLPSALDLLAVQIVDEHPRVRLEAARALGGLDDPRAVEVAMRALDQPLDEFLDYALWLTARELEPRWLPELEAGRLDFDGRLDRLTFALKAVNTPRAVRPLLERLKAGAVPADRQQDVLEIIGSLGDAAALRLVLELAADPQSPPQRSRALLSVLERSFRQRKVRPSGRLEGFLSGLLDADDAELTSVAARCAGLWHVEPLRPRLVELARAESAPNTTRLAAIDGLAALGGNAAADVLRQLDAPPQSDAIRTGAVRALIGLEPQAAADRAVALLAELKDPDAQTRLVSAFLAQKQGPRLLTAALDDRELPEDAAKIALRVATGSGQAVPKLIQALTRAGGITSGPKVLSESEMAELVALVGERGDAARGEQIFRRADLSCFKCHAIGGAGGRVGPDLVSLGASAQVDYLIDSILQPNKNVKENYQTLVVSTLAGKVVTGVKVRQTDSELLLRDAEDREIAVPLDQIDEQVNGSSLMPAGLTDKLTRPELIDLVRFMSELGKVGKLAVGSARVVRRWEALLRTDESAFRLRRTSDAAAATDDPSLSWVARYSTVAGALPLDELPVHSTYVRLTKTGRRMAYVRCELEVTTPGPAILELDPTGLKAWLDESPLKIEPQTKLELERGRHQLTLAVDLNARQAPLRIELMDAPDSPAQVQLVGGK